MHKTLQEKKIRWSKQSGIWIGLILFSTFMQNGTLQATPPRTKCQPAPYAWMSLPSIYRIGQLGYKMITQLYIHLYHDYWLKMRAFSPVRLPLKPTASNPCDLETKQELLDQRGIQIELEKFPESLRTHPIVFDLALCKTMLGHCKPFVDDATRIKRLTFDDLDHGLSLVCNDFVRQVRELNDPTFSYAVFTVDFKSSEWITTRMLRLLPTHLMPSQNIRDVTKLPSPGKDGFINVVFMDECHYSGQQIQAWLSIVYSQANLGLVLKNKLRFWILAPFVSQYAETVLKYFATCEFNQISGINIRLISTNLKFPQPSQGIFHEFRSGCHRPYLLLPEWKAPDSYSFPEAFQPFCYIEYVDPLYKFERNLTSHEPSMSSLNASLQTRQVNYPPIPPYSMTSGCKYADQESLPFFLSEQDNQKLNKVGLAFNQHTGVISGEVLESVRLQAKPFYIFVHQPLLTLQRLASKRHSFFSESGDFSIEQQFTPAPYILKIDLRCALEQ